MVTNINPKIKVAQVITRMDWAGSADLVKIFCQDLDKDKYEVKLIMGLTKNPSLKNSEFLKSFSDNIINITSLRRDINLFWDIIALFKLYNIFKKEKFDIVHANTAKAGFLGRIAAYWAKVPAIIYMSHGHLFYGYFNSFMSKVMICLERFAAGFTDVIIALTELEKKDFLAFKIKPKKSIEVIPSGLRPEEFSTENKETKEAFKKLLAVSPDKILIGFVGRLEPVKGCEYFIMAAAKIKGLCRGVNFLIVGEGSLRKSLERMSKALNLADDVLFLGWREDALEIISGLDILVQPSLNEAVGRTLLEAQAQGIPVVASSVGGIPEIVKDNISGCLVPAKDVEALSEAIYNLLDNARAREAISQGARQWIRDNFSSKKMMQRINEIYDRLFLES
ncbi:MAG: glycosyltransferase family 4 protein [Candidatus Omnitrophica bacterium]|nr:glycosyltransferase family 4 protein [Candidatus Omnitrophota bacterium]